MPLVCPNGGMVQQLSASPGERKGVDEQRAQEGNEDRLHGRNGNDAVPTHRLS